MGNFYTNVTVSGPGQAALADYLKAEGRRAYLSPTEGGKTVVFERNVLEAAMGGWDGDESDEPASPNDLAPDLSRRFSCPALAVMVHDDDIFSYDLYRDGTLVDQYNSSPDYFAEGSRPLGSTPEGGDAESLCATFGAPHAVAHVEAILRLPGNSAGEDGYVFEMDRHADLAKALELPECAVATGYHYIEQGDSVYDPATWIKTGT